MAENLASILDRPHTEIKAPEAMPAGHYTFMTIGLPRFDKSTKKGTEFVEFKVRYLNAYDDVDADELEKVGGCEGKETNLTFYLTEKSAYRLGDFLKDDLKIDHGEDTTVRAMIDESPNKQFVGQIKHTPSDDGKRMYANIASTGPVED